MGAKNMSKQTCDCPEGGEWCLECDLAARYRKQGKCAHNAPGCHILCGQPVAPGKDRCPKCEQLYQSTRAWLAQPSRALA